MQLAAPHFYYLQVLPMWYSSATLRSLAAVVFMGTTSDRDTMEASTPSLSIVVEKNPTEARLLELGIKSWPKWGCPPGKFPLKFDARLTCYLLKGKVKASAKGSSECVGFGAGDLVVFPKGLSCTWEVLVSVDKHYNFDSSPK